MPAPTVIRAMAGAPQNCAITGLAACARARSGYRVQCTLQARIRAISMVAASAHTTVANTRSPGRCSGRMAAALATMPVPMTAANQFGPRSRNTSARPFQFFEEAERPVVIRLAHRACPRDTESLRHGSRLAAGCARR